ncbi:hypothetical protein M9H77_09508 [Catharanthus roseus]|uniref:Uncharacterized protein n=1 Tax=Catharanthus roseus TaxID=4058 RepID=A0ACC0C185_CATRO|nr:hypothetical protein M9H77_09508 [Catharanthus roseus]
MSRNTIAEVITSIQNAYMDKKRMNSRWDGNRNYFYFLRYNDRPRGLSRGFNYQIASQWQVLVRLDNEDLIISYVSRKIYHSFIRILPGDIVKVKGRDNQSVCEKCPYLYSYLFQS